MAVNPTNGHLFVAGGDTNRILDVDPVAQTWNVFVNGGRSDGLAISSDGSTLYSANQDGHVVAYDTATGDVVFNVFIVAPPDGEPDGLVLGTGVMANYLYVNTTGGTVVELDLDTLTQTVIASGGSRGDFAKIDPYDGNALLTQSDRIVRLRFPQRSGGSPGRSAHAGVDVAQALAFEAKSGVHSFSVAVDLPVAVSQAHAVAYPLVSESRLVPTAPADRSMASHLGPFERSSQDLLFAAADGRLALAAESDSFALAFPRKGTLS